MMKIRKVSSLMTLITVFLITLILGGCQKVIVNPLEIPQYVKKEINYLTETVIRRPIYKSQTLYAKVNPIRSETYSFKMSSGYIDSVLVTRATEVKEGDLLVTLNDADLLIDIRDMEINYEIEKLKIEKLQKIYESTGTGKYDYDMALLDFKITQFQYDALMEKKEALNIYATFDGKVDSVKVTVNKFVNKNDQIITVIDDSDTYLSFADPDIAGLVEGVEVNLYISTNEVVKATIVNVDKKEKLITIEPNVADSRLEEIGKIWKVEIILDQINDAIAVKESWIHEAAGREFVYVLENGIMTEREISKGKTLGGWVEILLGLQEGDEIIINQN